MSAVFKKELRDCLRWAPLGMVLGLVMLWMMRPTSVYDAVGIEAKLMSQLGLAAGLIAIALGLLQSLFDTRNDSRGYLLHRPIRSREIFWGKIAAGYVAYMIALAVPLLVAIVYLQVKGIERLPTNAFQIIPFLLFSLVVFLLHPTVLWIANRDARWVGTRLLPSVGAMSLVFFLKLSLEQSPFPNAFASVAFWLSVFVAFASVTLIASRHAFVHQSQLPPRSSVHWRSIAGMLGLVFSGVVLYGVVFTFFYESLLRTPGDYITYELSMNDQGVWQQIATRRPDGNWNAQVTLTRSANGEGEFTEVDKGWKEAHSSLLTQVYYGHNSPLQQFHYMGSFESDKVAYGSATLVKYRDRILLYDASNKLVAIVTPDGRFKDMSDANGAFDNLANLSGLHQSSYNRLSTDTNPLLVDDNGLYQLDANELRVNKLLDGKVDSVLLLMEEKGRPASLWTLSDNKLTLHNIASTDPNLKMPQADSLAIKNTHQFSLPPLEILSSQTFQLDPVSELELLRVLRTPEGQYAMVRTNWKTSDAKYSMLTATGGVEVLGSVTLPELQTGRSENWIGWTCPPAIFATLLAIMSLVPGANGPSSLMGIVLGSACHAALAAIAAWWLGGRLSLSHRERTIWTIIGAMLGFGVLIGLISIYRKPIKGDCPRCSKPRRIDLESCEHCGQAWDPPPEEGVEIFERDLSQLTERASSLS